VLCHACKAVRQTVHTSPQGSQAGEPFAGGVVLAKALPGPTSADMVPLPPASVVLDVPGARPAGDPVQS